MPLAIKAEGLSKRYRLGTVGWRTAVQDLRALWSRRSQAEDPPLAASEIWALRDATFHADQGEVLGIIGRNGAGKSTLLKVLSRVTRQTAGTVYLGGRTASLLEVGTGFHPELTGRDNVFLNGAILGMKRNTIRQRFSDIVDFAGVGPYLDTPVKRYSSGMKVRLGFAVAAHLDADILIVDEVLAVGDFEFQKRCLNRMQEVIDSGRSVVFVSHNMDSVVALTQRCLWIDQGKIKHEGPTAEVVGRYLDGDRRADRYRCPNPTTKIKTNYVEKAEIHHDQHRARIRVTTHFRERRRAAVSLEVRNRRGQVVCTLRDVDTDADRYVKTPGRLTQEVAFSTEHLAPDAYYVTLSLAELGVERLDFQENALAFQVTPPADSTEGGARPGMLRLPHAWTTLDDSQEPHV